MGQRRRDSLRGASGVRSTRALASRSSATCASTRDFPQSSQSGRSAGGGFQQDHQVAISSGSSWRGRRNRKECVGGCAQESASTSRGSTSVGADRGHPEVHRARKETGGGACRRVRSVGTRVEGRVRQGVVGRLARLRVEVERPTAPVPDPATEVQRLQHQLAQAQAQLLQHGCTSVSAGSTAKRPRRREDFVCSCTEEVIEWMSDRQRHPRDRERQCGRGGQIVEFGGPSSDEFATTPTFHGGAICPSAREFIWSGKRDDSMRAVSTTSSKVWAPGQSSGRGKQPRTTEISVAETRPFRPSCHSECGSQSRTVSDRVRSHFQRHHRGTLRSRLHQFSRRGAPPIADFSERRGP